MRTVFYIIAPTSSGKTTSAKALSNELKLPLFHADLVYNALAKKYGATCHPAKLTQYEFWDRPEEFGITSWGSHKHMNDAKREAYRDMLSDAQGNFIIEGFTLSFPLERRMITDAIGEHRAVILRILLSFDLWKSLFSLKFPNSTAQTEYSYGRLNGVFETQTADILLTFSHPSQVNARNIATGLNESSWTS